MSELFKSIMYIFLLRKLHTQKSNQSTWTYEIPCYHSCVKTGLRIKKMVFL